MKTAHHAVLFVSRADTIYDLDNGELAGEPMLNINELIEGHCERELLG